MIVDCFYKYLSIDPLMDTGEIIWAIVAALNLPESCSLKNAPNKTLKFFSSTLMFVIFVFHNIS